MHRAEWYPAAMAASSPLYSELEFFVRSEGGEVTRLVRLRMSIGGGWSFFGLGTKIGAVELT